MTDHLDPTDDPTLRRLRHERPVAAPSADVRSRHRTALGDAMSSADHRRPRWRVPAVAAACVTVVAGIALAVDRTSGTTTDVSSGTGDGEPTVAPAGPDEDDADAPLMSPACGGPLPFAVPAGEAFTGPLLDPAPGQPDATSPDQLVAHWTDGSTQIEARWPADEDAETRGFVPEQRDALETRGASLTGADLQLDVDREMVLSESYTDIEAPTASYEIAVTAWDPADTTDTDSAPRWGDGMCAVVQLTVLSARESDVLPAAEEFYGRLTRPGGPLVAEATGRSDALVAERTTATALAPVTPCSGIPAGDPQPPTESTPVPITATHATPDDALTAHIETMVVDDLDGPFGRPRSMYTVPTAGYTAIELPDGRVAFDFPDVVAYFVAESVEGGWAITRYEGPTC